MIRYIYFDLGNVLLTFDRQRACRQLEELTGAPADRIGQLLFASGLQDEYERGGMSSQEMYEAFCSRCSESGGVRPDYRAFHRAHSDIFHLQVPVVPIVMQLQRAGYPLGILSNTCEEHWQHVARGRFTLLTHFFRDHVLSHETHCIKPDAGIYEVAASRAGVDPQEIFFVDDRADNVAGARQFGIDAVLFQNPQRLAADLRQRGVQFNY